ncbi:MOSC domain-containing protein [soil metagenome]
MIASSPSLNLPIVAVNVGTPAALTDSRTGKVAMTGIVKRTVDAASVTVGFTNILGDGQADLQNHGGPDKAVYCYSHDHLAAWRDEIGYPDDRQAPFGENLSVIGATEDDVHIGDRWRWGNVVLEIAQPRWPCFKLGLHAGLHDLPARLIANERCGWYCRVIVEGRASTVDSCLTLLHRNDDAPTVREAFQASRGLLPPDRVDRIASNTELAISWRQKILRRYERTATEG